MKLMILSRKKRKKKKPTEKGHSKNLRLEEKYRVKNCVRQKKNEDTQMELGTVI